MTTTSSREFIREQAESEDEAGEANIDAVVDQVMADGRAEQFREDIRLRQALDRIASEVKRIPADLARAREKLWTPGAGEARGRYEVVDTRPGGEDRMTPHDTCTPAKGGTSAGLAQLDAGLQPAGRPRRR